MKKLRSAQRDEESSAMIIVANKPGQKWHSSCEAAPTARKRPPTCLPLCRRQRPLADRAESYEPKLAISSLQMLVFFTKL